MSKSKVAYEKKIEIVRDYLDGRVGYKESIRRANNSAASFRHWVHLYEEKERLDSCQTAGTMYIRRMKSEKRFRNTFPVMVVCSISVKNMESDQQLHSANG